MIVTIAGVAIIIALWLAVKPKAMPTQTLVGEMVGLLAIWLMSTSLLSITEHRVGTYAYGGVSGQLWWHRVTGTLGLILSVIHPQIVGGGGGNHGPSPALAAVNFLSIVAIFLVIWAFLAPGTRAAKIPGPLGALARIQFDVWRVLHGILGLYVAAAAVHAYVDAAHGTWTPVRLGSYVVVVAVGAWAFVDRLVVLRVRERTRNATVVDVTRIGSDSAVLKIQSDHPMGFAPGHFVYLGAPSSKERPHPFTVAEVSPDGVLSVGIKAAGAGTQRLVRDVQVGERVHLSVPQGELDYYVDPRRTVWVAGGAGIAPMKALIGHFSEEEPEGRVTLLWSRRSGEETETVRELRKQASLHEHFDVEFIDTTSQPRISVASIIAAGGVAPADLSVRLCGPQKMVVDLLHGLRKAGVPDGSIHVEAFAFR